MENWVATKNKPFVAAYYMSKRIIVILNAQWTWQILNMAPTLVYGKVFALWPDNPPSKRHPPSVTRGRAWQLCRIETSKDWNTRLLLQCLWIKPDIKRWYTNKIGPLKKQLWDQILHQAILAPWINIALIWAQNDPKVILSIHLHL